MSRKEGDGSINLGDRALPLYEEIGMVPDDAPDIGEGLVIGPDHIYEVTKCSEKYPLILPPSPEIAHCQDTGKGNEKEKKRLRDNMPVVTHFVPILPRAWK